MARVQFFPDILTPAKVGEVSHVEGSAENRTEVEGYRGKAFSFVFKKKTIKTVFDGP